MVDAPLSSIAERWLRLNGVPFSLKDWPMHRAFYDGRYNRTLFKTSRQVAKSTTLANYMIIECAVIPHFSTMFVSPSKEQTVRFSNSRVAKVMRYSPMINNRFLSTELADRVFHKQYGNGAEMLFTYGCDEAERLRGPSTDRNMYDEVQDMLYDPIITVGNETMANSNYAYETYAGTPKSMENTIQYLWELSTQTEWVIKCESCSTLQFIDSEKSIGLRGPICLKCKADLNTFKGAWVDMNPVNPKYGEDKDTKLKGFHLNAVMMPFNCVASMKHRGGEAEEIALKRWKRILTKFKDNPLSVFRNEVLGVSDSIGSRLLSKDELLRLCREYSFTETPPANFRQGLQYITAGIDWSGGGSSGVSRTVLWIWGYNSGEKKLITLFYKIYPGHNPVNIVQDIGLQCRLYDVMLAVGDAGEGHLANNLLKNELGEHRVYQVQYGAQKKALVWNGVDKYLGDRTVLLDNYFMALKNQHIVFANPEQMHVAIEDILSEYEEITIAGRKVWRHSPQKPDDCLHAGLFGWLAYKIISNSLDFTQSDMAA
jgi:hypothetical protein